jgi:hypothetical protein
MAISTRINRKLSPIYRYGFEQPYRQSLGRPFIRLLNWYTGFGKTHTAACFALDLFLNEKVIPVFLAPLQSMVTGFAGEVRGHLGTDRFRDDIESAIRSRGASVPIYRLYSREYHSNDRTFFQTVLLLEKWLQGQPLVYAAMEKDLSNGRRGAAGVSTLAGQLAECRNKCNFCLQSDFHSLPPYSDDYEVQKSLYERGAEKVLSMANRITRKIIDMEVRSRYNGVRYRFMREAVVDDMVQRLFPLQAFGERPGIIIGTAAKAKTSLQVLLYDENEGRCKWADYDSLFEFARELNTTGSPLAKLVDPQLKRVRVVTFIDEEEDSYWHLFDQHKSVVNPQGRNDLNEVIGEFHKFLDLKWPFAFEHGSDRELARKVFQYLWAFADISSEVEQIFNHERLKNGASFIAPERAVAILHEVLEDKWPDVSSQFTNEQLSELFNALVMNNDVHNDFHRFRQKAHVLKKVREFVHELPKSGREDEYSVFRRVRDLIFDKKFFLMSRSSYGEMLDQPSQTFFNASSNIMTTDYLSRLELLPETGNQTIRLEFREHSLKKNAFTLLHYLKFVLLIADVLNNSNGVRTINFTKDDQDRYPNLYKFARDVRQLFKSRNHQEGLDGEALATEPVDDDFFFAGTKSVVSLDESHRQAVEYNATRNIALSLSIISLRDTPEEDLRNLLGENNGIYLISATGGLQPASTGAFNQRRLQGMLKDIGGRYFPMTPQEVAIVAAEAQRASCTRRRDVQIVDDSLLQYRFPTSPFLAGLLAAFFGALPSGGVHRYDRISRFKEHEVRGLVASLDRLLSTPRRSALCLCLSMQWARTCLIGLAQSTAFVKQLDHIGHHFVVDPMLLPQYRKAGVSEKIHIVLYAAGQFKKRDTSQIGAVQAADDNGQFSDELLKALDITDKKVLLWTAYRSAARGVNFITRRNGEEVDFEMVYLVNSPFYNRHTQPKARGFHMESFQSLIQVLNDRPGGATMMNRTEFLYEYARHRWAIMRLEHFIDLCRTLFQALGRVERRPDNFIERQEIFLDVEVAKTLELGTRFAPELRERASATQIAVLNRIDEYNRATALFADEEERRRHSFASLRLAEGFKRHTEQLPRRFRSSPEARTMWESMFDERMVTDPKAYIAHLQRCGVPDTYCKALYFRAPSWATLYGANVHMLGKQQRIITDYADGTDSYDWVGLLAPASLLRELPAPFCHLHKFARGFPDKQSDGEYVLVPQPWFVIEIIKGYIAEQVFLHFVQCEFGLDLTSSEETGRFKLLDVLAHPKCADIYQKYDFYIEIDRKVLLGVDIKNWTRLTDHLKKEELEREARLKHRQLNALFPGHTVHALYVNLYGAHKYTYERQPVSGAISFMSMYVQSTLFRQGAWIPNANLTASMLWSGA